MAFGDKSLFVPRLDLPRGTDLRVRIRARDVSLSLSRPAGISTLNVFEGRIAEVNAEEGPLVDVLIDVGVPLIARITRRSMTELVLEPGKAVFALIKSVAIDRHTLGVRGTFKDR